MASELDLETGDESEAQRILEAGQEARANRASARGKKSSGTKRTAASATEENALTARLNQSWQDLADMFQNREDPELADVLRRRGDAMTQGLMSLTRTLIPLRKPLVFAVAFLEPVLGFWELGSLLAGRYVRRRAEKIAAQQMANGGVEVVQ
jgi:hypothetical protein